MPGLALELDVRWGDMDAMGHVNNTVFFRYLESARIAYYEAIGMDALRAGTTHGPGLVATNLNFRRQLKYPARVRVLANVAVIGRRSFRLDYRIVDLADDATIADGSSTNVWVDYAVDRAVDLPPAMLAAIRRVEGNPTLGAEAAAGR